MKRLSLVTKRMKELNFQDEENDIDEISRQSNENSDEFLSDIRRKNPFRIRSTSVPGIDPEFSPQNKSRRLSTNFSPTFRRFIK